MLPSRDLYRERFEELQRFGLEPDRPEVDSWWREIRPGADEFHRVPLVEAGRRDVEENG